MKLRKVPKNSCRGTVIQWNNFCLKLLGFVGSLIGLKIIFTILLAL